MPQVHNKSLARSSDGSAFSKNSRFMSVNQTSSDTAKRLQARLKVEKRLREHGLAIAERYNKNQQAQINRLAAALNDSLLKKKAYKRVLATKSYSKIKDKEKRLNTNYSIYALRYDIAEQLRILDPANVREEHARQKVDRAKDDRDNLIQRNLRTILSPRARIRKRLRQQLNLDSETTMFSTLSSSRPTPSISRQRNVGLVVTKSFIKDKNPNDVKAETFVPSQSDNKLPPIKASSKSLAVPETKIFSPLPQIKSSEKKNSKVQNKKNGPLIFNSQKPSLPAIKIN